jgi:hypothetical protein
MRHSRGDFVDVSYRVLIQRAPACGLIVWLILVPGHASVAAQASAPDVKAAFTINFLKFVEWPAERVPATNQPYLVAVLNDDAIARALSAVAANQTVDGRSIVVRAISAVDQASDAHLVFIGGAEERRLASLAQQLADAHVLTVGDTPGFGRAGVMLNLFIADQRVQFEANTAAASRAGLRLRAQLLRLARIVG